MKSARSFLLVGEDRREQYPCASEEGVLGQLVQPKSLPVEEADGVVDQMGRQVGVGGSVRLLALLALLGRGLGLLLVRGFGHSQR